MSILLSMKIEETESKRKAEHISLRPGLYRLGLEASDVADPITDLI
jgi:hypothetical protein